MITKYRITRFALVGAVGTLCQYIIFISLNELTSIRPYVASILSATAGSVTNYLLNYYWTFFGNKVPHGSAAIKTAIMVSFSIMLNGFIVYLLEDILFYLSAQIVATAFVFFFNYLLSSFWVFQSYGK